MAVTTPDVVLSEDYIKEKITCQICVHVGVGERGNPLGGRLYYLSTKCRGIVKQMCKPKDFSNHYLLIYSDTS